MKGDRTWPTIKQAAQILGPIRAYYSVKRQTWLLDQIPVMDHEVRAAAWRRLVQKEQSRGNG